MPAPIYLDHSATTPVRPEVFAAMEPFYGPKFGNPSSIHGAGRQARSRASRRSGTRWPDCSGKLRSKVRIRLLLSETQHNHCEHQ